LNISYTEPLSRAWNRMKAMLFRPFRIESWFVLGASAFLARLFEHTGSAANWHNGWRSRSSGADVQAEQTLNHVRETMLKLLDNPLVLAGIAVALVFIAIIVLVCAWVSARAEFVFLDGVATKHARFSEPWRRLGALGRSLFLWRAAFSFAYLPGLVVIALPFLHTIGRFLSGGTLGVPDVAGIIVGVAGGVVLLLVVGWFSMLMDGFVVPLMYRYNEGSRAAWARFWPLLTSQLGHFLAYTVFLVVLSIATGIAITIVAFGTCCVGLVLLIIPYVGTVALLPVLVTGRALPVEFMAQFGPEWATFPAEEPDDEPDAVPPPPGEPPAEPRPVV
jgi:hypothetical protein